jgi:hypothetical protein
MAAIKSAGRLPRAGLGAVVNGGNNLLHPLYEINVIHEGAAAARC